ncbi:MAG: MoxR family ATPase [Myxococcota bacterium]
MDNVALALHGKRETIKMAVTALLAEGHLLIEDVPGVGKTTLARGLARSLGLDFRRVQCTSDLMPADVLGGSVYDANRGQFDFRKGPIFTDIFLADEVNRTTPKTQSALLEAMAEGQVSIDGTTYPLGTPFFVVATQNPQDSHGVYPLPESQLDRFLLRIRIGYPPAEIERQLLRSRGTGDPVEILQPVVDREDLLRTCKALDNIRVEDVVLDYLYALIESTRQSPFLQGGASTRAALALERAVRAHALVEGRAYATPDDVQKLAIPVMAHRLRMARTPAGGSGAHDTERVLQDLLSNLSVPV